MTILSRPYLTMLSTLYTAGNGNGNKSETAHYPYLCQPHLSPNGSEIAFCYAGDVWIASSAGGRARRVTTHPSPRFTSRLLAGRQPTGDCLSAYRRGKYLRDPAQLKRAAEALDISQRINSAFMLVA